MNFKHTATFAVAIFLGLGGVLGAQQTIGYYAKFREQAAADVKIPPTGWQYMFVDEDDHLVYVKDSTDTVTAVGGGGGGSVSLTCGSSLTCSPSTITGTGSVSLADDITFAEDLDHTIKVADETSGAAHGITIVGGSGAAGDDGGDITINGGLAAEGSDNGSVRLGASHTAAVIITPALTCSSTVAAAAIGPNSGQQHTLPAVSSDTVALLAASQALSNKTLTAPVINGATSASGNFDLSGSTGTQKSTTGAQTYGGSSYIYNQAYVDSQIQFSLVTGASSGASTVTSAASSVTTGALVHFPHPFTITGVRTYYVGGSSKTLQCKVWDSANSLLQTGTVAVNAAGPYVCSITPITVSSSDLNKKFTIGIWENSGALYTYVSNAPGRPSNAVCNIPYSQSAWVMVEDDCTFSAGDARPATSLAGTTQYFPVEVVGSAP